MSPHPYINRRGRIGYPVPYNGGLFVRAEGVIVHVGTDTEERYENEMMVYLPFSSVIIRLDDGRHVTGKLVDLELLDAKDGEG